MKKVTRAVLITLILLSISFIPALAEEYKLDAQNQSDGSIVVTFDLLVTPELKEIKKKGRNFLISKI